MAAVHRLLPVLGLAVLSACAGTQTPQPPRGGPELVLGSEGLDVGTTGLEIGFGRAPEGAIAAISGATGSRPVADAMRADCGGANLREVRFDNGLSVYFRDRMLIGWSLSGMPEGRLATAAGLTTGLTREAALSLPGVVPAGAGLAAGQIAGRLGPDGRVIRLQSGRTCG